MMKARQATRGRKPMAYRCQSEGGKVSVRIYSRLGDVLRLKGISVTDLRSSIANRFGFAPDMRTLARWARPARVRRLDMELAWTVAAVLDVRLEEVFAMEEPDETADRVLDPEEGRRLHELYNVRRDRGLTEAEQSEMDALIATYSRRTYERGVRRSRRATVALSSMSRPRLRLNAPRLSPCTKRLRPIPSDTRRSFKRLCAGSECGQQTDALARTSGTRAPYRCPTETSDPCP